MATTSHAAQDISGVAAALAADAHALHDALVASPDPADEATRERLRRCVLRPLRELTGDTPAGTASTAREGDVSAALWSLTMATTEARVRFPESTALAEASAALQQLTVAGDTAGERVAELAALHAELPAGVQLVDDGPYLVTNAERLVDHLGDALPVRPQMALCRCGASASKPWCDGTHAEIGFSGAKDPARVPDRRDAYEGVQVTVFDNRGTCQHAGFCTDRAPTAFRTDGEPFVAASGARMDELVRAARDCPSGALSFGFDGVEQSATVDHHGTRAPEITVSKDGPYRVVGGLPLRDADGTDVPRNHGASREHYALCRCGHSQNKPFCSGRHWQVEFRDPIAPADGAPTVFEWAGGLSALTRMTRLFYEKYVPQDPLLAPLFASMSPDHPQRVAAWLAEVFCGPHGYSSRYGGYSQMLSQHVGRGLTEEQRRRWVALLCESAAEAGLPNDAEFQSVFRSYLEWGSRLAVENSQVGGQPPEHMPMPHWDWHTAAGAPGSRRSALAATDASAPEAPLPAPEEPLHFDQHVRPLFRRMDRESMRFAFDLWSHADVSAHAEGILARLEAGSMPCDGAWPAERTAVFRRWVEAGAPV